MSSTQHQLIEQCAIRLRGIVEALDNIHDSTPHRWSTDLDDVHSSAESLLAMIKDQAPTPCIDCKGTGFCNSISGEEIRCPCHAPIQFADPAQTPVEQFEQAPPSEDQLTAAGLSYPLAKEDAVKLWYAGFRSEVVTVLEAWEAIGHDIGMNPSKGELLDSLRYMLEKCEAHDDALARVKALEALVAARIKDVPVDAPVIAVVGDFNEEQVHECKRFHDAIRAQRNPKAIVVFLNSKNDIQAVDEAAMCAAGWVRAEAPVAQAEQAMAEKDPFGTKLENIAKKLDSTLRVVAQAGQVPQAWLDVQAERRRQITVEGRTPEHDDEHDNGEMARAAACYALAGSSAPNDGTAALLVSLAWPWDEQWWKPSTARRDLIKAGALILAEIERIDRVAASQGGPSDA
ncbi:hypothetical protein [Pseudomonas aeruginosa]|uniref:hypothetical protein n=2 Tax=Pseudomonas aeruginosa TaxID=287 RepID=UPI0021A52F94|nr:hypothetical protein [Pseudomonas aeruginosa]UWU64136.1 hypothetical protein NDR95_09395 [Pseudomonas aeruginosa]